MPKEKKTNENAILVGTKPSMNYVLAVVNQFTQGSKEVVIKARGRAITRAVDTAEIVRNRFIKDAKIKDIIIGTEAVKTDEGGTSNISTIEIFLTKKS